MAKNDMAAALESINKILVGSKGEKYKSGLNIFSKIKDNNLGVIPFGIPTLDEASSIGGIPRGKVVELFGLESSGKSWLTLKLIASAQRNNLRAGLLDAEHAFVPEWAANQGVNLESLLYGEDFSCGEECLDQAKAIVSSGAMDLLVIDSTAALTPKSDLEGSFEDQSMGTHARMMSKAVKQINDYGSKSGCTTVFINQIRNKIGVMFGNPEDTPGGKALKFYAHMRIRTQRIGLLKGTGQTDEKAPVIGIKSKARYEKNRVGKPFGEAEFEIYFDPSSNDPVVQLVDLAYRKPLQLIKRKKVENGDMHYLWTLGKEIEDSECTSMSTMAEWLSMNEYVLPLLDRVEEKAKEEKIVVPEEIVALRQSLAKDKVQPPEADSQVESEKVSKSK